MKLKEKMVEMKKNMKAWWEENGHYVVISGVIIAGNIGIGAISYLIGKETGQIEERKYILGTFDTKRLVFIDRRDDDGNVVSRQAVMTEKLFDAFKHPEKLEWYENGSFEYVDELKED